MSTAADPAPFLQRRETWTVAVLVLGAPLGPIGWAIGAVAILLSKRWTVRNKVSAAILSVLAFVVFWSSYLIIDQQLCDSAESRDPCGHGLPLILFSPIIAVLAVILVVTAIRLLRAAATNPHRSMGTV